MPDDLMSTDNGLHRDLDEVLFHKARSLEGVVRRKVQHVQSLELAVGKRNTRIRRLSEHLENLRKRIIGYKERIAELEAQVLALSGPETRAAVERALRSTERVERREI